MKQIISFLSVFLLCSSLISQQLTDPITQDPNLISGKLSNGLSYFIRKNAKPENRAELRLVVNAGSVLESDDQQGIAHFLEHMAFNGTKNFPKNELLNYLEKAGVRFGADLNATTGFDHTIYMLPISSNDPLILNNGYQVLRDWAGDLLLDKEEIDRERGVIIEEKRMRQNATQRAYVQYIPVLTNGSQYGSRVPIGKEEIIRTAPKEVFQRFYSNWYRPDNMAVIVVGDIDVAAVKAKIELLFSDLKNPANAPVRPERIPITWHAKNKGMVVVDAENTNNMLSIYLRMEPSGKKQTWADQSKVLMDQFMVELISARLRESVVKPGSPVTLGGLVIGDQFLRGYDADIAYALTKEDPAKAISWLTAELLSAKQYGFTESEVERTKKIFLKRYQDAFTEKDKTESSVFASQYIDLFLESEPSPGIEAEWAFVKKWLNSLSVSALNTKVKGLITDRPAFIFYNTTSANSTITAASLVDAYERSLQQTVSAYKDQPAATELMEKMPVPGKILQREELTTLGARKLTLSNGIKVVYKPTTFKNDEVQFRASMWGGRTVLSGRDLVLAKYISVLTTQLGFGKNRSSDMPRLRSGIEANVSFNILSTQLQFMGGSTAKDLEKLLQLFYLKVTSVNFDKEDFNSLRSNMSNQFGNILKNPMNMFNDTILKYRFLNPAFIGGFPLQDELNAVQSEEMKDFYERIMKNLRGMTLYFSGNIDPESFEKMVTQYIASIPTQVKSIALNKANLPRSREGKNILNIKGGKENKSEIAHTYYGNLPEKDDASIMAFSLLTDILQMQANKKLREEMGNTYSPRVSSLVERDPVGQFSLSLNVSCLPENSNAIIDAFDGLIQTIIAGKLDEDDLNKAKMQSIKAMETRLTTNMYWVLFLEQQQNFGLDQGMVTSFASRTNAVTKEQIIEAAKKFLQKANVLKAVMDPLPQ